MSSRKKKENIKKYHAKLYCICQPKIIKKSCWFLKNPLNDFKIGGATQIEML